MANIDTSRPAPFGAEFLIRMTSRTDALRQSLVQWNNKRATQKAVSRLSDRQLSDIGLSRYDVDNMDF